MIKRFSFLFIFLLFHLTLSTEKVLSQDDAPFGLAWGSSTDDVRSLGVELKPYPDKSFGVSFLASSLPKVLSDQDATLLSFGINNKLWRVVGLSKEFPNDPYGVAIKSRYQQLLEVLTEKYGKPTSVHRLGGSIYSEPRYFVSGLRGGETNWYTNFNAELVDLQINLNASDSSTSRWKIIFEYKPLRKLFEADKSGQEKGTL